MRGAGLARRLEHFPAFLVREQDRLAGRAEHNQPGGRSLRVALDIVLELFQIYAAIGVEGRGDRRKDAVEEHRCQLLPPAISLPQPAGCGTRNRCSFCTWPMKRRSASRRLCTSEKTRRSAVDCPYREKTFEVRSACSCCNALTFTSPLCSAAMPSAAARAAASVVMVGMRAVTAARRMAFSSKKGSGPCGVLTISWMRSPLMRSTTLGRPSFTL